MEKRKLFAPPGARIFKSGLAVMLCLGMQLALEPLLGQGGIFYALIASVICMQHDVRETLSTGVSRMVGTLVGAVFGYLFLLLFESVAIPYARYIEIAVIPLVMILAAWLCVTMRFPSAVSICCVVFLGIAVDYQKTAADAALYVVTRTAQTALGIAVAMLVNHFVFPPKAGEEDQE